MLNTLASLVTGAMIIAVPVMNENTDNGMVKTETMEYMEGRSEVSFSVSVNSTVEELEDIKAAAEEAGMGFTYKKRGVKARLVIDMVIETADDYFMDRIVIREEDGTKQIKWEENEDGKAVAFIDESSAEYTQNSK